MARLEKTKNAGVFKVLGSDGEPTGAYKTSVRIAGRQHWKTFNPPDALKRAQAWRSQVAVKREEGTLIDPRAGRTTLQELYDELHGARSYAQETLLVHEVSWRKIQAAHLDQQPLNKISTPAIEGLLRSLDET